MSMSKSKESIPVYSGVIVFSPLERLSSVLAHCMRSSSVSDKRISFTRARSSNVCRPGSFPARVRSAKGNQIAELGPTLWVLFIMLFLPLMALGTLGFRYALFVSAARLAASSGSQCFTFLADPAPPQDRSAVSTAQQIANQAASAFTGIALTEVNCYIVTAPLAGGALSKQAVPLSSPADTSTSTYNFEVVLKGQLAPLVPLPSSWFMQIPGLSTPISTSAKASVLFESTQGLTQ